MTEKDITNQAPMTRRAHRKMKRQNKAVTEEGFRTEGVEHESQAFKEPKKGFFRRERKVGKPLATSRTIEQEKTAALGRFLNKAILGVLILLIIVFIAIFYF